MAGEDPPESKVHIDICGMERSHLRGFVLEAEKGPKIIV